MYKTLESKKTVFNEFTIHTLEDLNNLVANLGGNPCLRFRGVNESKYTMLTSLQRMCQASLKEQKEYVSRLLHRLKRDTDVIAFFEKSGIVINDMSCLALMQHQMLPTPLLDFSTDINIALAFAADGVKNAGSEETDEYVSLYVFDKCYENEIGMSIQQLYSLGMSTARQTLLDYMIKHPSERINASVLYSLDEFVKWNDIKDYELMYVEYQPLAPGVVSLSGQELNLSNPNLDRQKGCFIFNLFDENMPLEKNWNCRTIQERNKFWLGSVSGSTLPFSGVMTKEKITCFDIKKDVIKEWAKINPMDLYDNSMENQNIKQRLLDIKAEVDASV